MPEEITRQFLARLWELQADAGLSDAALARRLEVHRTYISHMKSGRKGRRLTMDFALRAIREFPPLAVFLTPEI